jgi:hypothetical protein
MDIEFIAAIAVIAPDAEKSRELFIGALGLPLEAADGSDCFHSERIDGTKHFGVWPLSEAAQACYGTAKWPEGHTVPQVSVEFEVHDADAVESAASCASEASRCYMAGAMSRGARLSPGFNRLKGRSSGSRTRLHCGPDARGPLAAWRRASLR